MPLSPPLDRVIICGLADLEVHLGGEPTHVLSILDPGTDAFPAGQSRPGQTTLFFDDAISGGDGIVLPSQTDVAAIRGFARSLAENSDARIVVHCHFGTSRSPAAFAIILAEMNPALPEDEVFEQVLTIRPRAWPNSRMIALADEAMARQGRLVQALHRLYGRQLLEYPDIRDLVLRLDRAAELEAAIAPARDGDSG